MSVVVENLMFSYCSGFELKADIKFEDGIVATLLGPNGSGKSTLLKCMNALLRPRVGSVYVDGREVGRMKGSELAKLIGYVPQSHSPVFPYTVLDFVLMGRTPHLGLFQHPSEDDIRKAEGALKLVGLFELRNRPYTELSGGQRQLVLLARALAQEPKVLLLDEPTAHLDFKNQFRVLKVVRDIARRKVTVILTLHDPNLAYLFSDFVAIVKNGRILACGRPDEVFTSEILSLAYDMRVEVVDNGKIKVVMPAEVMG